MVIQRYLSFNSQHPSTSQIREFLLSLQGTLKHSSVHIYYRSLKTFFNWLVAEGYIEKSPMQNIKVSQPPDPLIRPFSREDIDNLLILCSGSSFLDIRNRAIILLFIDTGLRLSELASIQYKDVDSDREVIKVKGKGAKECVVKIGHGVQKVLLKYMNQVDYNSVDDCIWVTEERKPMKRAGIQIAIRRLCHRAEITDAKPGPHTFRHTAAINLLRNGMGEFVLQVTLGCLVCH